MIRKTISILLATIIFSAGYLKADEGMWIPILLKKYNIKDMQKKGFKLTAEDIYSINKASMKDAVMIFGGGCTGELISDKGLIITNHHCGYGAIQSHSSLDHDYLTDGFWAKEQKDELKNEGLTVSFLVRMEDVTEKVLKGVSETTNDKEREKIIEKNILDIVKNTTEGNNYKASVKPFFYGNQYFLFVQEVYSDIRLVGAPPSAIGKFGGDTDNWMWPRHTGDFSLFRIYVDKNNKPAEYSEDNVPFKPKKHFPISIKGVKPGDFTMVFGYPGSTQEYLTSYAVNMIQNEINPKRIAVRQRILDIMNQDIEADRGIRIKYASKYARVSNAWKKWIGQNRGLKRLNAVARKQKTEQKLTNWINSSKDRIAKYGNLLPTYKKIYDKLTKYEIAEQYFFESIWSIETVKLARQLSQLRGKEKGSEQYIKAKKAAKKFFKNYNLETDKKLVRTLIQIYYKNAGNDFQPKYFNFIKEMKMLGYTEDEIFDKYTEQYFKNTFFTDQKKTTDFFENYTNSSANEKLITNSPAFVLYKNMVNMYIKKIMPVTRSAKTEIQKLGRSYMKALMEADTAKIFYPDANFTLRVAYGQVDSYYPRDGVKYKYFTTLKGIMEKDNPEIYDYKVPEKLKELYKNKDYGQYAENGEMHVCFLAKNHTTGGNSGSPVINGNGELIGVNFDRNWEGTMSDIMYAPDQCRNISLDIRYALFLIEKFAGNKRLIDEMDIVK